MCNCWETVLHVSCIYAYLWAEALAALFWTIFSDLYIGNNFGSYSISLWSRGQIYLLSNIIKIMSLFGTQVRRVYLILYKIWVPSVQGSPAVIQTHCKYSIHPGCSPLPCGNWGTGNQCDPEAYTAWVEKSFVSNLGVLCLLLAFMRWWQVLSLQVI